MKYLRAAIRMASFVIATLSIYGLWLACAFFIPNKLYWRQLAFRSWAGSFMKIARIKVEVIGSTPRPPFFLVTNHLSYTDIPVLRSIVEGIFVAKGEIEGWFL